MRYQPSSCTRRAAHHRATLAASIPEYASDLVPVRGQCRGRRCKSRWGVRRVSIDFRDPERVDRLATVECAVCGRTWRRCKVPRLTSPAGYQEVRLTLILRATVRRWVSRGRWHREGDDAIVIGEATVGDLDEAARNHRAIADRLDHRRTAPPGGDVMSAWNVTGCRSCDALEAPCDEHAYQLREERLEADRDRYIEAILGGRLRFHVPRGGVGIAQTLILWQPVYRRWQDLWRMGRS